MQIQLNQCPSACAICLSIKRGTGFSMAHVMVQMVKSGLKVK